MNPIYACPFKVPEVATGALDDLIDAMDHLIDAMEAEGARGEAGEPCGGGGVKGTPTEADAPMAGEFGGGP